MFVQVLAACRERGLVDVGRVALDGTKIGAAASKDANRSVERLSELEIQIRQILAETVPDVDDSPSSAAVDDAVVDDAAVDGAGAGGGAGRGCGAEPRMSDDWDGSEPLRRRRNGLGCGGACQVFCVRLWFMLSGRGVRGR